MLIIINNLIIINRKEFTLEVGAMTLKLEWVCGAAKTPIVIWDGEVAVTASLTLFNKGDLGVDTGTGKDFCLLLSC